MGKYIYFVKVFYTKVSPIRQLTDTYLRTRVPSALIVREREKKDEKFNGFSIWKGSSEKLTV